MSAEDDAATMADLLANAGQTLIIAHCLNAPRTSTALQQLTSLPASTVARHLNKLERLDVLQSDTPRKKRYGKTVLWYANTTSGPIHDLPGLKKIIEHLASQLTTT